MEVLSSVSQIQEKMATKRVLQKEAMTPNFLGVIFQCGCGHTHAASSTPHILCGSINEFFHQCENQFVTLVKYKGIFRISAAERWSCPADLFWDFVNLN